MRGNRLAKVNSVFTSLQHTVMKNKQDKYEPKLNNGKKYGQLNCNFFATYYLSDLRHNITPPVIFYIHRRGTTIKSQINALFTRDILAHNIAINRYF